MRGLFFKACILFLYCLAFSATASAQTLPSPKPKQAPQALSGKVDVIYDGQQFVLENYNVTLWGLKAPAAGTTEADQALDILKTLIQYQKVYCLINGALPEENSYLARCGTAHFDDLSFAMIESGFADVDEATVKSHPFGQYYISARNSAQDRGDGIWKAAFEARQAQLAAAQAATTEPPKTEAPQADQTTETGTDIPSENTQTATETAAETSQETGEITPPPVKLSTSPKISKTGNLDASTDISADTAETDFEKLQSLSSAHKAAESSRALQETAPETPAPMTMSFQSNSPDLIGSLFIGSFMGMAALFIFLAALLYWLSNRKLSHEKIYGHSIAVNDLGHLTGRYGILQRPTTKQPDSVLLPMELLRDIFTYDLTSYKLAASSQTYGAQSLEELKAPQQGTDTSRPASIEPSTSLEAETIPSFLMQTETAPQHEEADKAEETHTETNTIESAEKSTSETSDQIASTNEKTMSSETIEAEQTTVPEGTPATPVDQPSDMEERLAKGDSPLRIWREYRGFTLETASQMAGISKAYLSQIERGKKNGSTKTLQALADALDISLAEITQPIKKAS